MRFVSDLGYTVLSVRYGGRVNLCGVCCLSR